MPVIRRSRFTLLFFCNYLRAPMIAVVAKKNDCIVCNADGEWT